MTDEQMYGASMIGMLLGLVAALWGLWALLINLPTMFWEEAPGVVVSQHTFQEKLIKLGDRYSHSSYRSYICLRYEYDAGGTVYTGWRINPGYEDHQDKPGSPCQSTKESEEFEQIKYDYRKGTRIWALFDPSSPQEAVLESGLRFFDMVALFGGIILFGFALFANQRIRRWR